MKRSVFGHSSRLRMSVVLPALALAGSPSVVTPSLQGAEPVPLSVAVVFVPDTIDVPTTPLESAAVGFGRAWGENSSDALAAHMASTGIRIQLQGTGRSGLSVRQAVASIGEFLRPYRRGGVVVSRAAVLDSSPDRGFAEILWSAMAAGTPDARPVTVFVGFIRSDGVWKVDEIRLVP